MSIKMNLGIGKVNLVLNPLILAALVGSLMWAAFFYVLVQTSLLTALSFFTSLIVMTAVLLYCASLALERHELQKIEPMR